MKTERNVKFISNIAEVHPKSPTGNLVKTERNVKFISNIAEKGADGIRLRLRYHIHGRLLLVREEFLGLVSLDKKLSEDVSSGLR